MEGEVVNGGECGGWHCLVFETEVNRKGEGEMEWKVVDFDNVVGGNYFG